MTRKTVTDIAAWPALTLEGNLLSPAMLAAIDRRDAPERSEADYGVRKGLTLRDEIAASFRVGQAHYDGFAKIAAPTAIVTARFVRDFLRETLGFDDLSDATGPVALVAGGGRIPVVVVPPTDELDRRSTHLSADQSRSAASALQDRLNRDDDAMWGLASNGATLRLMRDNASLTRPTFVEADLAQIFATEDMASFALLWLVFHRSRFGRAGTPAADCALERWREAGARAGEAARDRLAGQVEQALKLLGSGFLDANKELRDKIAAGDIALNDWFNELLRLVYRLIFLMVAEDRGLLHTPDAGADARRLYADGYSLVNLRARSARRAAWDRQADRYEGLKIVFRALTRGEAKLGLPALGGLFAPGQLPTLEGARISNRAFLEAIYRLGWLADGSSMVPVNWQAMETEELGSVYESLLELQPQLADDGRALRFATESSEQKGNQRKTTGSYYTPDSLVQALLNTALDPVLERAERGGDDPVEALLSLTVIDPACGSGHFLLAAARRIATRVARIRAGGTPSAMDFRHALRDAARRCIHGTDRNRMAVELTKVALWIETVDPGLPLGFFDAQIRYGDALLGVFDLKVLETGIPDAAYKPLSGDDRAVARHYAQKNKRERAELEKLRGGFDFGNRSNLAKAFAELRAMPESTLDEIAAKSEKLKALTATGAAAWTLARACDLYCAAFLLPKIAEKQFAGPDGLPRRGAETVPTTGTIGEVLRGTTVFGPLTGAAVDAARRAGALHWPLEFPDVMARGGFDVVLGNPPWERIKLQEQEFFAARDAEIAEAPNKAARERAIKELAAASEGSAKRALYEAFIIAKHEAEAASEFVRVAGNEGGRYALTGRGDVNTYALFAELFGNLARERAGVIVPTGIATDATTAPFFADLIEKRRLAQLVDFENSAPIFLSVHRSFKFSILTIGRDEPVAHFAFFLTEPSQLAEPERNFTLMPQDIAAINPNTKTAPVFRSRADAELTAKIYSNAPVLIDESKGNAGNPWGISFARLFDMANDSNLFRTAVQLAADGFARAGTDWTKGADSDLKRYVPLYEAKMIHYFDHRFSGYGSRGNERGHRVLPETVISQHADPLFEVEPFYWVPFTDVENRLAGRTLSKWLIGWKDITASTNERTLISSVFPRVGAGDTLLVMIPNSVHGVSSAGLVANLSSIVTDYAARQKIGGIHLKYNVTKQLPILPPSFFISPRLKFIAARVLELSYTSYSLTSFAQDLGYDGPPFAWNETRRAHLRADLDAFYARAYGLTRDELRYILDPADVKGPDYPSETFRVLKDKEIRQFGEYRTRRLVLEAWDRMESDGTFKELDL
jgi:hypothetical protein